MPFRKIYSYLNIILFVKYQEHNFPFRFLSYLKCVCFYCVSLGDNVFVHGIAATPTPLLKGLCDYVKANDIKRVTLHHLHLEGETPWTAEEFKGRIRSNSLFTGSNLRQAVNEGIADFNSCFLQEVPLLFRKGAIKLNAALIHVSPPDANGYCSLGTSVDTARAAITNADYIIAMANKHMPRTFGDGVIHSSHIDALVEDHTFPLHERHVGKGSEEERKIGAIIAENLVENGATLQMVFVKVKVFVGIGAVPDAALLALKNHKDLGIHTEMFSDGVLDLINSNVITNSKKAIHPGKLVVSFVYGSTKLYNYLHDNPLIEFGDVQWVNDPAVIRQNPKVTAINSAVEVDLTGQVVSDSVGKRFLSGFGGQVDFIRGAAVGNDGLGKPIIALPSVTKKGQSKIVPYINEGSGVVTTRSHVHYVVTEYGIAQLWGKNMRQRAYELIKIAHPSQREFLEKAAFARLKVYERKAVEYG
ncbi:putative 4-hydroxybutyrate coenzyme A transferase [Dictyocaulus viviparus]|uniref:Putative 4-hydroxybutyrate coenzyme A transferase n=1 Tax=Dictyocaulus viviparus TaxID=29172 RepID=A0A0D8XIQ2_DICVI|nr:putative 4-hydroxybutyrate coenzyme A transferase [Dictyocaulus viviparus]